MGNGSRRKPHEIKQNKNEKEKEEKRKNKIKMKQNVFVYFSEMLKYWENNKMKKEAAQRYQFGIVSIRFEGI